MICFKDKTWCGDDDCKGACGYPHFTEKDQQDARCWWGSDNAPVAFHVHQQQKETE